MKELIHTEIVLMLLERSEVNPGAKDNQAIRVASARGYTEIVKPLLERTMLQYLA